ncbi:hypothetical protein XVE_2393 [Xanthomonas vesicatoria ATCC 35937]|uniref:Uncharacterized protein n=1 Tax=Xanthomonas vesicatoria ATCC 35937 TaxID=925775 RepID=F1W5A6_9XANT|nr:hypothetical protein XVE_2393 [Xanthomonas vesicatoria ATCC 35937]
MSQQVIRLNRTMHCLHMHTGQLDWSLPAHHRGTFGMDAATELTWTYLRRIAGG